MKWKSWVSHGFHNCLEGRTIPLCLNSIGSFAGPKWLLRNLALGRALDFRKVQRRDNGIWWQTLLEVKTNMTPGKWWSTQRKLDVKDRLANKFHTIRSLYKLLFEPWCLLFLKLALVLERGSCNFASSVFSCLTLWRPSSHNRISACSTLIHGNTVKVVPWIEMAVLIFSESWQPKSFTSLQRYSIISFWYSIRWITSQYQVHFSRILFSLNYSPLLFVNVPNCYKEPFSPYSVHN